MNSIAKITLSLILSLICLSATGLEDSVLDFQDELERFRKEIVNKERDRIKARINFPLGVYSADAFGIEIPDTVKQYDFTPEMFDEGFNHFFHQEFIDSVRSKVELIEKEKGRFILAYKSHNGDYKEHNMKGTCVHTIFCLYENEKIRITGFDMKCFGEG